MATQNTPRTMAKVTESVKDAASSVAQAAQEHVIQPVGEALGLAGEKVGRAEDGRADDDPFCGSDEVRAEEANGRTDRFCGQAVSEADRRGWAEGPAARGEQGAVVRVFWPVLRDNDQTGVEVDETLRQFKPHVDGLERHARRTEERSKARQNG